LNPFLQLADEKKDSKNSAARKYFGPSYFVTSLEYTKIQNLCSKFPYAETKQKQKFRGTELVTCQKSKLPSFRSQISLVIKIKK
jgi:hypothetical protein